MFDNWYLSSSWKKGRFWSKLKQSEFKFGLVWILHIIMNRLVTLILTQISVKIKDQFIFCIALTFTDVHQVNFYSSLLFFINKNTF